MKTLVVLQNMQIIIVGFLIMVWFIVGVKGFVHYWTKKYSLHRSVWPLAITAGFTGPFAWVFGWYEAHQTTGWFDLTLLSISLVGGLVFLDFAFRGGPDYCMLVVGVMAIIFSTLVFGSIGKDKSGKVQEETKL